MATNNTEEIKDAATKKQEVINFGEFPHPLKHTWTFWCYEGDKNKTFEECQRKVASFDTVEDFWSLYNNMPPPSKIRSWRDYSVFKQGIPPSWQHDANKDGGRWLIQLGKKRRNVDLDCLWQKTVLCMIGDAFNGYSDNVCGAVVNVRPKGDKISLWMNINSEDIVMEIGRKLKERLNMASNEIMVYQIHSVVISIDRSAAKNSYTL